MSVGTTPIGPGDLVAVLVPPGPAWVDLASRLWNERLPFLPVDGRLPRTAIDALLDATRPSVVVDPDGTWRRRDDGIALDPDVGMVVMTSGTTGEQRAVVLERAAVEAAVAASTAALPSASPDDGWLCCLPLAHVGGLNVLMRALIGGAPVTVTHGFDEGEVDAAIATGRIAFTSLVPTTLARCLDAGVDLARLQAVLVGGAALGEQLAERARREGVRVITTYGMTETCGGVVYDGVPFAGTEMRVEASGAIALRGPTLMRGYLRADDATRVAITPDGWFTTGDLGRLTPDGRLEVLGRADDAILSGGEIVMPEPVEEAIRTDHRVSDVAVVGIEDPAWGQRVVAFVIPTDVADPPSLEALRDAVAERLPRYAAPHDLVLVDRLPRTPSGKIRRRDLAHPAR